MSGALVKPQNRIVQGVYLNARQQNKTKKEAGDPRVECRRDDRTQLYHDGGGSLREGG